jgi:hypothetical protein
MHIFGHGLLFQFKGSNGFGHPGRETAGELDLKDDLIGGKLLPMTSQESDVWRLGNADRYFTIESHPNIIPRNTFVGLTEIPYPRYRLGANSREVELELVQGRAFPFILGVKPP